MKEFVCGRMIDEETGKSVSFSGQRREDGTIDGVAFVDLWPVRMVTEAVKRCNGNKEETLVLLNSTELGKSIGITMDQLELALLFTE